MFSPLRGVALLRSYSAGLADKQIQNVFTPFPEIKNQCKIGTNLSSAYVVTCVEVANRFIKNDFAWRRICYTLGRMAKFAHQRAESFYQSRGFSEKRGGVVTPWNWNTLLFVCRDVHFYAAAPESKKRKHIGGIYGGKGVVAVGPRFGKTWRRQKMFYTAKTVLKITTATFTL